MLYVKKEKWKLTFFMYATVTKEKWKLRNIPNNGKSSSMPRFIRND